MYIDQYTIYTHASLVQDGDGDIIRCRWAVGSECEGICQAFSPGTLSGVSHSHYFLVGIISALVWIRPRPIMQLSK